MPDGTSGNGGRDAQAGQAGRPLWLSWVWSVAGWLVCAFMCLWFMVELETWPNAYDLFFWAVILLLFGNIFMFLFVVTRWGLWPGRLLGAVARVCVGEGLILLCFYLVGRFAVGS